MKIFLVLSIFLLTVSAASAQMYERSVGVRLGYSNGIFFDKQNQDLSTYRFMMSERDGGRHFTAMKFFRKYDVDHVPEYISFYYGFGGHVGYIRWDEQHNDSSGYYVNKRSAPVVGFDALLGVSYDFETLPISLTADIKPFIDLWGRNVFQLNSYDFAIGAIYSF